MFYEVAKNNHGLPLDPFYAMVGPRPIGWISTLSLDLYGLTRVTETLGCICKLEGNSSRTVDPF